MSCGEAIEGRNSGGTESTSPMPSGGCYQRFTTEGVSSTLPVNITTPVTKDSISELSLTEETTWTGRLQP